MTWTLPPESILPSAPYQRDDRETAEKIGAQLTERLDEFGCRCEVEKISIGPQVTRYEMVPIEGLSVRKLPAMVPDLAFEVAAETLRVIAPIPGRRAIGIEVPTPNRRTVLLRDTLSVAEAPLTFPLGIGPDGKTMACDISTEPHMLIGGMTGSGKSTMINAMLCALMMRATPDDLGLILIDPKRVEFAPYENVPHLMRPVVTDSFEAAETLDWLVDEMEARYKFCERAGVRNLAELNDKLMIEDRFPHLLCVVDELADLMVVAKKDVEASVVRIAQKARAVGIHLVLATQSPRVQVVTGLIKANLPARIAFTTAGSLDSRVIMDRNGAETLLNYGDGLYKPGDSGLATRFQAPYIDLSEVEAICGHWRAQNPSETATEEMIAA